METARIKQPIPGLSVAAIVRGIIGPGEENGERLPIKYEGYLRTFCSNDMQKDFPDRKYSVKRDGGEAVLVYFSVKDDQPEA